MTGKRNNCFTFLRYLFALCIFCNHLCYTLGEDIFLCGGGIFVCGFFAMSGFLNFNSYQQTPSPWLFAKKRFKRIYPAYSLTVILCTLMGGWLSTLPLADYIAHADTWKYLFCNLCFLNYLQPTLPGVFMTHAMPTVNSSLWTMKVEVLFYISVPIVHWLILRYGKNKVLWSIIIFSLLYNYLTNIAYFSTGNRLFYTLNHQLPGELAYFYIPVLMLQSLDWVKRHGRTLLWISFFLLLPSFFDIRFDALYPLALPVFVITFAYECKWLLPTARWKDYSYEFYLLRFPTLQALIALGWGTSQWNLALIALPLIFVFAIPLHYLSKGISNKI